MRLLRPDLVDVDCRVCRAYACESPGVPVVRQGRTFPRRQPPRCERCEKSLVTDFTPRNEEIFRAYILATRCHLPPDDELREEADSFYALAMLEEEITDMKRRNSLGALFGEKHGD